MTNKVNLTIACNDWCQFSVHETATGDSVAATLTIGPTDDSTEFYRQVADRLYQLHLAGALGEYRDLDGELPLMPVLGFRA